MDLIKRKIEKQEKGIALVITIILIGISLLVSLGVSDVLLKEFSFSLFSQKSSKAFYAADSGLECASYWDRQGIFLDPSDVEINYGGILPNSTPAPCLSEDINSTWYANIVSDIGGGTLAYKVFFDLFFTDKRCVKVSVYKTEDTLGDITTTIESYGYDVGKNMNNDIDFSNLCGTNAAYPNREERMLKLFSI